MKFLIAFIFLSFTYFSLAFEDNVNETFLYFPKAFEKWDIVFLPELSLAKIPLSIVEEEINQSPMLGLETRFGLPSDISLRLKIKSNYIANFGSLAVQWSTSYKKLSFAAGGKFSAWFGHLDLESIKLKAEGMILSPYVSLGYNFDDFLYSVEFETHTNRMWTQMDEIELTRRDDKFTGISFNLTVEQPLWHNHYVAMGVNLNYAKFFYQSWLSYSTLNEYLLYPEFKFGFIL